jgi:hypothetical protein
MTVMQEWVTAQDSPEIPVNENFDTLGYAAVYGYNPATSSGLTWGYYGGRWGGFAVAASTLTLTDASTNYIVVQRSDGVISVSAATTNWNNNTDYARVYRVTTSGGTVSNLYGADFDYRAGDGGIFGSSGGGGGGGGGSAAVVLPIAVSDETSPLTTGAAKVTFRIPYNFTLTELRASVNTAPTGSGIIVDVAQNGASILSTLLTIDSTEKTSVTAASPVVIGTAALTDDAEITVDIDAVGSTIAGSGLKLYFIGTAGSEVAIPIALGDESSDLTTGAGKFTFRMPYAFTLNAVRASVTTAPTGAAIAVDINEGGVSLLSTVLTIDATEKTSTTAATPAVIGDSAIADDAEITIDIDAVGSTVAGSGLKVYLIGVPA